jgi:hypothetical protein
VKDSESIEARRVWAQNGDQIGLVISHRVVEFGESSKNRPRGATLVIGPDEDPLFTDFSASNLGVPANPTLPYYQEARLTVTVMSPIRRGPLT